MVIPFKRLLSTAIISLINKTWAAGADLLERAEGAVAPSLVSPGAAGALLIMWHGSSCLVIRGAAAATPRMHQGSEGFFFLPALITGIYHGKKKKKKDEKPHQVESEEDEGEKSVILSLIFSLSCLSKCREIHLALPPPLPCLARRCSERSIHHNLPTLRRAGFTTRGLTAGKASPAASVRFLVSALHPSRWRSPQTEGTSPLLARPSPEPTVPRLPGACLCASGGPSPRSPFGSAGGNAGIVSAQGSALDNLSGSTVFIWISLLN